MKVFHQAGHNTIWNLSSFMDEGAGDGIVFSPVHYLRSTLEEVDQETRNVSLFDPQFYVPDSQKNKLQSYEFFPEKIMDGFSTDDFEVIAYEAAKLCVEFQSANEFKELIIGILIMITIFLFTIFYIRKLHKKPNNNPLPTTTNNSFNNISNKVNNIQNNLNNNQNQQNSTFINPFKTNPNQNNNDNNNFKKY